MLDFLKKFFGSAQERRVARLKGMVAQVNAWEERFSTLSDGEIKAKTEEFKKRYSKGESLDALLPEAYAVVKNVCRRLMGTEVHVSGYDQKWDMIPYDVQILGAIALHQGTIAEMQTGEGKTLTATMPLYLNALAGKGAHLVTVNDYLAARDCAWVGSILRYLGLTTGVITTEVAPQARKAIYNCDVIYGTASEFGFDYLRDNAMCPSKADQVQRGFYFAIIDEIDSILIDEARTPLIISGPAAQSFQMYSELKEGVEILVKKQRDLCNRLASEAKKVLDKYLAQEGEVQFAKEDLSAIREACHKLWIVNKGTPHNKILRRVKEHPDFRAEIDKWDLYYHGDQNKEEKLETLAQLYFVVDERGHEFELTDLGIHAWAEIPGGALNDFVMLDLGHEYSLVDADPMLSGQEKIESKLRLGEEDMKRKERFHNLRQLLRAHLLMEKDVDYIIDGEKIVIIDEHTGRPQPGRRFSDGLHQSIEAKENVVIQRETQTYATITLQNYFRMYAKLAGMTGTAITEAGEFKEIYKLEVLQIPTYKPSCRADANDEIYMTEREKYNALLKEIREVHGSGRPILIGTESVEASEKLSRILRQQKLEHVVLNAKHNAREAETIAEAGKMGAITVSTNMAGRGTDIKLKEGIAAQGGLHVIGTARHQSRRIDRQLKGRCARLGDPGSSKFFISFEDELLRLFASPRLTSLLKRFRPPEGESISSPLLNRSIETAQKRVEGRNYMIRKYTLEYDDVMNKQRHEIYDFRNEVLGSQDLHSLAKELLVDVCAIGASEFFVSRSGSDKWDPEGYRTWLMEHFPVSFEQGYFDDDLSSIEELEERATQKVVTAFENKFAHDMTKAAEMHKEIDTQELSEEAIRSVMIRKIDELWQEHLLSMDHLRSEVNLRTVAQKDPLLEFKHEAFRLFHTLTRRLKTDIAHTLFRLQIAAAMPQSMMQDMLRKINLETGRLIFDAFPTGEEAPVQPPPPARPAPLAITPPPKAGRNDPCPCQSGKKYKKCCGPAEEPSV